MSEKADIKIVQIGTVSDAKSRRPNGKSCKHAPLELSWYPGGELFKDAHSTQHTPAEADRDEGKMAAAMRRVRQWLCKRFGHKKTDKKAKGKPEEISQSPTSLVDPNCPQWAEVRKMEADMAAIQKEQGVKDAEWRTLTLQLYTQRGLVDKMQKHNVETAQLESQLSQIMLEKMELEEKSHSLKNEFNIKMDNSPKPKMVSVGVQTDNPSTEQLNSCYTIYKSRVAQLKEEILAHIEQLNALEQLAAKERKNRPAGDNIQSLKVKVEDIFGTQ